MSHRSNFIGALVAKKVIGNKIRSRNTPPPKMKPSKEYADNTIIIIIVVVVVLALVLFAIL